MTIKRITLNNFALEFYREPTLDNTIQVYVEFIGDEDLNEAYEDVFGETEGFVNFRCADLDDPLTTLFRYDDEYTELIQDIHDQHYAD